MPGTAKRLTSRTVSRAPIAAMQAVSCGVLPSEPAFTAATAPATREPPARVEGAHRRDVVRVLRRAAVRAGLHGTHRAGHGGVPDEVPGAGRGIRRPHQRRPADNPTADAEAERAGPVRQQVLGLAHLDA